MIRVPLLALITLNPAWVHLPLLCFLANCQDYSDLEVVNAKPLLRTLDSDDIPALAIIELL